MRNFKKEPQMFYDGPLTKSGLFADSWYLLAGGLGGDSGCGPECGGEMFIVALFPERLQVAADQNRPARCLRSLLV